MINPLRDFIKRFIKGFKIMLPDTLFFETPEKALNHPTLLGCIGRYIL